MTRIQPSAGSEPDADQEVDDPVARVLRRRPIRAGTVLTQPSPPPPVPHRGSETGDEPGDLQPEAATQPETDVVADIDELIDELAAPPADPRS